jgi:hypothetical protein
MQFTKFTSLLSLAALASANSVLFKSLDNVDRTIFFTGNAGLDQIQPTEVPAGQSVKVYFPTGWTGNFYSVSNGADNVPGMLGEVAFNAWNDITFFDVSAIVNPNDHVGIKQLWPASAAIPTSGCVVFPCDNAYYVWNDAQTKSTGESDLICTLGTGYLEARTEEEAESPSFKRDFVLGKWSK